MSYRFRTDKNGKVVGVEFRQGATEAGKQLGIKSMVFFFFFNEDGTKLTWYEFIKKIETVGLEYSGETLPIDEDGNTYKIQDVGKWIFDVMEGFVIKEIKEQTQDRLVSVFINKEGEEREAIQTKDEIIIRYNR